jgi:xanthine dehydrogenase iron-sulfur cluster and FAD-binding subunit A
VGHAGTTPAGTATGPTSTFLLIVNSCDNFIELDPRRSMLDVLRETLNLTGTKKGCNQGARGASHRPSVICRLAVMLLCFAPSLDNGRK